MKISTQVSDINRLLAIRSAQQAVRAAEEKLMADCQRLSRRKEPAESSEFFAPLVEAHRVLEQLTNRRLLPKRETAAKDLIATTEAYAKEVLCEWGEKYSGETRWIVEWGTPTARTVKSQGKPYRGSKSGFNTTDADHIVTLDPEGAIHMTRNWQLVDRSRRVGLPVIALYPDGRAVWVLIDKNRRSKAITSESGWVVYRDGRCGHSTVSRADAEANLAERLRRDKEFADWQRLERRSERRARLVTRLCKGAVVTLADAKALGYCDPGIHAFQGRYGIGDSATMEALIKTKDYYATALALDVARKLKRDGKENRTTDRAGVPAAV